MLSDCLSVRPSVCPLTPVSRDATSPCSVERFQYNLAQIFIMYVGIGEKVYKVSGQ